MTYSFLSPRNVRTWRSACCLAALCSVSTFSTAVRAQSSAANATLASSEFKDALTRYDAGDYAGALPLFRKAFEASRSPNARLYIARSLQHLGRLAEAYDQMLLTVRDAAQRAEKEPRYARTRDAASQELAQLAKQVGQVVINIKNPPPNVKIDLNGRDIPKTRLGKPIAVMPGPIVVSASGSGTPPVTSRVNVDAGSTAAVALVLSRAAPKMPTPARATPMHRAAALSAPSSRASPLRTAGFVTAGVGVAGFVVFSVAGLMANSKFSSVKNACHDVRCTDPSEASNIDSGKTLDHVANAGLIVGAIGVVAGGAMILLGKPTQHESVALGVSAGGATLDYAGRF